MMMMIGTICQPFDREKKTKLSLETNQHFLVGRKVSEISS